METDNFVKDIEKMKEKNVLDLSAWEDLSIALMNLVSLEEHSFFSYAKTKDEKFLKILEATREMRKRLLKLIVKDDENDNSERWCMSKHFLATSMRLYEVANRLLHEKKVEEAKSLYKDAAEMYGMFWMLNMTNDKKASFEFEESEEVKNSSIKIDKKEEKSIFSTIKKWLECCNE